MVFDGCRPWATVSVFIAFVHALLRGDAVEPAYLKAIGSSAQPRHAWRWLQSFLKQLPRWRIHLSPANEAVEVSQRASTLRILLPTLKALSDKLKPLSHFQTQFQQRFC